MSEKKTCAEVAKQSADEKFAKFKTSSVDGLGETIAAMANRSGGTIYVGVDDQGELVNVDFKTVEVHRAEALNEITPIRFGGTGGQINRVDTKNSQGGTVTIAVLGVEKNHFEGEAVRFRGKAFIRRGDQNIVLQSIYPTLAGSACTAKCPKCSHRHPARVFANPNRNGKSYIAGQCPKCKAEWSEDWTLDSQDKLRVEVPDSE